MGARGSISVERWTVLRPGAPSIKCLHRAVLRTIDLSDCNELPFTLLICFASGYGDDETAEASLQVFDVKGRKLRSSEGAGVSNQEERTVSGSSQSCR
jgi:hypothetical protein